MKYLVPLLFIILVLPLAEAQPRVKGTRVTLEPPEGFEAADAFQGFVKQDEGASIMVTEIPGPYAEVAKGFNERELASKQMKLIERSDIRLGAQNGILLYASQSAYGQEFLKWIGLAGDDAHSVLVVASFPKDAENRLGAALKAAVLSAKWDKQAAVPIDEGLTFSVAEAGELKRAGTVGNTLLFTPGGVLPVKSPDDPFAAVGSSASEDMVIADLAEFSRKRLQDTAALKEIRISAEADISVDSLKGRKIEAQAIDNKTGNKRYLYQAILAAEHGYFIFQGVADLAQNDKYRRIFETMLHSFKRKEQKL